MPDNLSEQQMIALWEDHCRYEFVERDTGKTVATMTEDPQNIHVPTLMGGIGKEEVQSFYAKHFIPGIPADMEIVPLSRTVGGERLIDELLCRFTHTVEMDWVLPGIPPTGKKVEVPIVVIVGFRDGKIESEHIYWDQASVLVQIGLLDGKRLPVVGVEAARKLSNPRSVPSDLLLR